MVFQGLRPAEGHVVRVLGDLVAPLLVAVYHLQSRVFLLYFIRCSIDPTNILITLMRAVTLEFTLLGTVDLGFQVDRCHEF